MPCTPSSVNASLTSSNLNGLMMASIFFMVSPLLVVGALVVLAQVKSHLLFVLGHAQTHQGVDDFENDIGCDKLKDPGDQHRFDLDEELAGIAEEEAVGPRRVDRLGSKQAGGQRAPRAADTVHAHHVERVVVTQFALDDAGEVAEGPRADTDPDRRNGPDEAGRGRDRHHPASGASSYPVFPLTRRGK